MLILPSLLHVFLLYSSVQVLSSSFTTIQAAKLGNSDITRYVSGYVWLIHGWYKQNWWKTKVAKADTVSCTDQQLEALVKRSIAILQVPTADNDTATTDVELVRSCLTYMNI